MNMINYLEKYPTFTRTANEEFSKRDTFHIGKVTQVNSDLTCSISSNRSHDLVEINAMLSTEEKLIPGACVLYKSAAGAHKTQVEILGRSPWLVD